MQAIVYSLKASSAVIASVATAQSERVASRDKSADLRSAVANVRPAMTYVGSELIQLSRASRALARGTMQTEPTKRIDVASVFETQGNDSLNGVTFYASNGTADVTDTKSSNGTVFTDLKRTFVTSKTDESSDQTAALSSTNGSGASSTNESGLEASQANASTTGTNSTTSNDGGLRSNKKLTTDQQREVDELKKRDSEVRAHEQAHKAVGATLAGSIQLSYQTGPDGKSYAVGGSVPIDLSTIPGDLEATISKMQRVQSAALAPASPSGPDQQIAAQAAASAAQARMTLAKERFSSMQPSDSSKVDNAYSLMMTA